MWTAILAMMFSASLWAGGADLYHWKDLELPHADKDRLFINYEMPNDKQINFPAIRLYNNRDMKGEPDFEFTARGTLEKGDLKCAIDNFACQYGPIYKRPWGYRDGQFFAVYFPIERQIDESTFEIKHGAQSYFLSLSNLKDYKLTVVKSNSAEHQNAKYYWIQKSHPYLILKFKEKMRNFEVEKQRAIDCLRSKDNKCMERYPLERSMANLKEELSKSGDVGTDSEYYKRVMSYDYTNKNMSIRSALADCLEGGKILTDVYTNPVGDMLATYAYFYSNARIDFVEGLKLNFECSFGYKADKSGDIKSINVGFYSFVEI